MGVCPLVITNQTWLAGRSPNSMEVLLEKSLISMVHFPASQVTDDRRVLMVDGLHRNGWKKRQWRLVIVDCTFPRHVIISYDIFEMWHKSVYFEFWMNCFFETQLFTSYTSWTGAHLKLTLCGHILLILNKNMCFFTLDEPMGNL